MLRAFKAWADTDIMFPGGPQEVEPTGAYDNTGGTVGMMLFAKHSLTSKLNAIPSSPFGHLKRRASWVKCLRKQ